MLLEKDPKELTWTWNKVKAGGMRPIPRNGVNTAVSANGLAYTFGGVMDTDEDEENLLGSFSNEMHALDLSSQKWRMIELIAKKDKKTKSKKGEDAHMEEDTKDNSTTVSNDGVFTMVVGSSSAATGSSSSDGNLQSHGNVPSPRMKPGLVVCKKTLYLYGGSLEDGNKQFTLGDFYSLGKFVLF